MASFPRRRGTAAVASSGWLGSKDAASGCHSRRRARPAARHDPKWRVPAWLWANVAVAWPHDVEPQIEDEAD